MNTRANLAAGRNAVLTVSCLAVLVGAGLAKDAALGIVGRSREFEALVHWLTLDPSGRDSWEPMYRAVDYFIGTSQPTLYQSIFFDQHVKFQYPPTSLLPLLLLNRLGISTVLGTRLMQLLSAASVLCIVGAGLLLARGLLARSTLLHDQRFMRRGALTIVLGALSFYPIMYADAIGQIQVMIDLAVCLAAWCWLREYKLVAGVVMAGAALVKPQYGLAMIWALLRGEWRFAKGFAITGIPFLFVSLAIFGLSEHLSYLSTLSFMGHRGEVFWRNQSVNGVLNRLLVGGVDPLTWNPHEFAPTHPLVYAGTVLSSLVLIAVGVAYRPTWVRRNAVSETDPMRRHESILDLATAIVTLTMASPIAWEHHYGVTWPIFVVTFTTLIALQGEHPTRRWLNLALAVGVSYFLVSNFLLSPRALAASPWNLVYSYTFAGGIILLAALIRLRSALGDVPRNFRSQLPPVAVRP